MSDTVSKTDNFLKAIEKYAEEQRNRIETEARSMKEKELSKAEDEGLREAYVLIQRRMADVKTEISAELSRAENASRKEIFLRRKEIEDSVFEDVKKKLDAFTGTDAYKSMLEKSAEEIAKYLDAPDVVLYVRKQDLGFEKAIVKAFGKECRVDAYEDIEIGGIIGESRSLGLLADETLDSRLMQQREWFCENSGLKVS